MILACLVVTARPGDRLLAMPLAISSYISIGSLTHIYSTQHYKNPVEPINPGEGRLTVREQFITLNVIS